MAFYTRRFTRIWLPWLFFFGLSALAQATIFQPVTNQEFWHTPLTWSIFLHQCVFSVHDPHVQLIPQDWSLGVELKASALLPFFIFLCQKVFPWSLLGVSIIMFALMKTGFFYVSFIFGVLLAVVGEPMLQWLKQKSFIFKIFLLIAGLILYETTHICGELLGFPSSDLKYTWLGTSMGCMFILMASMSSHRIQSFLSRPFLIFLGRISYSVYLLQMIVVLCLLPLYVQALKAIGIHQTIWLFPLKLLGSAGITVAVSALTYRWVETPCINLGHWLTKK